MKEKFKNIREYITFVLMGHVFNPLWLPRKERAKRRASYHYKMLEAYLMKYLPFVENLKIEPEKAENNGGDSKIFSLWFQGEENAPKIVKSCFKSIREKYGDRFIVLDEKTLYDWISLPDYIMEKWKAGKIIPANFSDICRIELLYQHGGMWFDATDLLTERVPSWIEESDFFMYSGGEELGPHTFIQTCFMRSIKGYPLLGAWRKFIFEYWKNEDKAINYFLVHFLLRFLTEHNETAGKLYSNMPLIPHDPTHVLWYVHRDDQYTKELFDKATSGSFFQKTNYKYKSSKNPIPGSMAEYIVNGNV